MIFAHAFIGLSIPFAAFVVTDAERTSHDGCETLLFQVFADSKMRLIGLKSNSTELRSSSLTQSTSEFGTSLLRKKNLTKRERSARKLKNHTVASKKKPVVSFLATKTGSDVSEGIIVGVTLFIVLVVFCVLYELASVRDEKLEKHDRLAFKYDLKNARYAYDTRRPSVDQASAPGSRQGSNQPARSAHDYLQPLRQSSKDFSPTLGQRQARQNNGTSTPSGGQSYQEGVSPDSPQRYPDSPAATAEDSRHARFPPTIMDMQSIGTPPTSTQSALNARHGPNPRIEETTRVPRPICHELVLSVKSRFKLPFNHLDTAATMSSGPIPVYADSSKVGNRVLLYAHIDKNAETGTGNVTLSLAGHEAEPHIGALKTEKGGSMAIWDKHSELYGNLVTSPGHHEMFAYSLMCGKDEVAQLRYKREPGSPGQVYLLSKVDGSQLANAFKYTAVDQASKREEEFLGVRVEDGMDPVLVLLCLLGAMVLGC